MCVIFWREKKIPVKTNLKKRNFEENYTIWGIRRSIEPKYLLKKVNEYIWILSSLYSKINFSIFSYFCSKQKKIIFSDDRICVSRDNSNIEKGRPYVISFVRSFQVSFFLFACHNVTCHHDVACHMSYIHILSKV